jgi:beta-glucosidase
MTGTWSVAANFDKSVSLMDGLTAAANGAKVVYAKGCNLDYDSAFEARATMFGKSLERDKRPLHDMVQEALNVCATADVIIAALGESAEMSGESSSRSELDIPQAQQELLQALLNTGKQVVLVLFTGRPLTIKWENERVPAILNVWFGGSEAGSAIADVLFGDVNPSGKLTTTWPQNVGQVPLYYNHKSTGRPLPEGKWFEKFRSNYLDVSNDPVYPFGYGLSYTSFAYGDVKLSTTNPKGAQTVTASVTVTNTGNRAGKEVVQLYVHDVVGVNTRPVKELKGFIKMDLQPGETKTATFNVTVDALKYYHTDMTYGWEPGEVEIMIGPNSRDVKVAKLNWSK